MTAFQRHQSKKRAADFSVGARFVLFTARKWDEVWTVTRIDQQKNLLFATHAGHELPFDNSEFDDIDLLDTP